jgi:hypothetical protein
MPLGWPGRGSAIQELTDIFLRKAEGEAMMPAMINSPAGKFPATPSSFSPANLPAKVAPAGQEIFLFESAVTH